METIRLSLPEDSKQLALMLSETWHENFDDSLGRDVVDEICQRTYTVEALSQQAQDPDLVSLVAQEDDALIGHALGESRDDAIFVHRLYVHPSAQRSGMGTRLYQTLLNRMPQRSVVRLDVIKSNAKARAFYERQGFSVVGAMDECLGAANVPSLKMEKRIGEKTHD